MIINMNGAKAPETPSPTLQEKTVTPETLPTVIGPDEGYDGLSQVTVNPDPQLKAENIRSGKTIFGVSGTFEGETIETVVNGVPLDYQFGIWPTKGFNIYAIRDIGNSSNTQYTTKINTYIPADALYYFHSDSTVGKSDNFRAQTTNGSVTLYNKSLVPSQFYCDKVNLSEPIVLEPGEYTVRSVISLFYSVDFIGKIAVFPVLQGNGGYITMPTNDYEIIENVSGGTNSTFKITTTKTFTIPSGNYIVDRGEYFQSTKVGFYFIPLDVKQVVS